MARIVVGIVRGGASEQYAHSLKTGAAMMDALPEDRYDVRDIFVDKKGYWHSRGTPTDSARILAQLDVVLNALHGGAGEDGMVQRILSRAGVPYAGSRAQPAALALNKARAREMLAGAGIRVPQGHAFSLEADAGMNTSAMASRVFQSFGPPYIVKPTHGGASIGVGLASSIVDLPKVLGDVLDRYGSAVVEEYVMGSEASVGVIEGFRGEDLYALPPVHVAPPQGVKFIDADTLAQGTAIHTVPAHFSHDEKELLMQAARRAHSALGLSHFSRADMILTPRGAYVLEVNAHPALHEAATFPLMLTAIGSSLKEFLEHAIVLAQRGV